MIFSQSSVMLLKQTTDFLKLASKEKISSSCHAFHGFLVTHTRSHSVSVVIFGATLRTQQTSMMLHQTVY